MSKRKGNIKRPINNNKFSLSQQNSQKHICDQYPAFSFRYLTNNKKFNLDCCFKNSTNETKTIMTNLITRLNELSLKPYTHWLSLGKKNGCETITYGQLKLKVEGLNLTPDEKIFVFRFSNGGCRILGVRQNGCPTLHIIGFDFKFKAYNH